MSGSDDNTYKQGDEFKVGSVNAGTARVKLEGMRQGRETYSQSYGDEEHGEYGDKSRGEELYNMVMQMAIREQDALQERILTQIDEAQAATAIALQEAQEREELATVNLHALQEAASSLPDGRKVYQTADGTTAYDDNGTQLSEQEVSSVEWTQGAPTWEERQQAQEELETARKERIELEEYQEKLEHGKVAVESGELSTEELEALILALQAEMPDAVARKLEDDPVQKTRLSAAREYGDQNCDEPLSCKNDFSGAHDHVVANTDTTEITKPSPGLALNNAL